MGMQAALLLDARVELAEGPCWLADRERLLWVNITAGHVHVLDPTTGEDRLLEVGQPVGAAVPADDGRVALAVRDGYALLDLDDGRVEMIADVEREIGGNRMNEGKCDRAGRFWAGTMALDTRRGAGALYRLDERRRVERMVAGVGISNGLGWSGDDRLMYYIDTLEDRVDVFDFDLATGGIANRRPFAVIDGPGHPDGMAVDAEGCLWVALWGGGRIARFLPDGTPAGGIEVPVAQVSSCCFGGPDLDEMFITTAWQHLPPDGREPHAGSLFHCRPGVAGQPAHAYRTGLM
ncbi:MAG TPA: SMP-30/gluconolactonase/LRE family protein [Terriglobales bacterium]|nr:SMP-30/gluconolactonase/LRE family protein [Terriglobales bacterium]